MEGNADTPLITGRIGFCLFHACGELSPILNHATAFGPKYSGACTLFHDSLGQLGLVQLGLTQVRANDTSPARLKPNSSDYRPQFGSGKGI